MEGKYRKKPLTVEWFCGAGLSSTGRPEALSSKIYVKFLFY